MRTSSALQEIERQQHLATCTHGTYSAIFPQARPRVVSYNVPKKNWIYYPNINRSYIIDKTYNPRIKTATDYYMPHRDLPREAPHHPLSAPAGKPRVTKATYPAYAANHKYIGQGRLEMDFNTSYTMAFNKPEGTFPARYTPTAHRDPLPRLGTYPPNPTQAWGQHVRNSKDYYESWPNTPSKALPTQRPRFLSPGTAQTRPKRRAGRREAVRTRPLHTLERSRDRSGWALWQLALSRAFLPSPRQRGRQHPGHYVILSTHEPLLAMTVSLKDSLLYKSISIILYRHSFLL